jgi:hypothetical protein
MSIVLFIVGALALMAGVGMIGFGIPINEFSFGNTLISAGTSAIVGGLIIIGLGAVVAQLRRLAEAIQLPVKPTPDVFEAPPISHAAQEGAEAFPRKSTSEALEFEPTRAPPVTPSEPISEGWAAAPALRNPDIAAAEPETSPARSRPFASMPPASEPGEPSRPIPPLRPAPAPKEERRPWRVTTPTPAETSAEREHLFETAWPVPESKAAKPSVAEEAKPEPKLERPAREEPSARTTPDFLPPPRVSEPRAIAILKSGVVDGMGYTLYVDGSIEADLPQGTLRFASISELRTYLEKSS